jgi:hypothetical protein
MTRDEIEKKARDLVEKFTASQLVTVAQTLRSYAPLFAIAITAQMSREMALMERARFANFLIAYAEGDQ